MSTKSAIVFVSNADDGVISSYHLDLQKGLLTFIDAVMAAANVTALTLNSNNSNSHQRTITHLYAVTRAEPCQLLSYTINTQPEHPNQLKQNNPLQHIASTALPRGMCYLTTDNNNQFLFAASYHGNMLTVSTINANGAVTALPIATYLTAPHPHSVVIHPNNRFVYVGNLGGDRVLQFNLDKDGHLTPIAEGYIDIEPQVGPRHIVIAPNGKYAYMITEFAASIGCFYIDQDSGQLQLFATNEQFPAQQYGLLNRQLIGQTVDPDSSPIWAADIKITPNGQYIYTSERSSSTVSAYRVDQNNGHLIYIDSFVVEKQPRSIAISPQGDYLIASGQQDDKIGLYRIDQATGHLHKCDEAKTGANSYWVEIVIH